MSAEPTKVLFVCLGNICRSPLAHGIFERMVQDRGLSERFYVDSAGTASYHQGSRPHQGSQKIARVHGMDISHQRSRPLEPVDLEVFDWVIAMDHSNLVDIQSLDPSRLQEGRAVMLLDYEPSSRREVPDPYYVGGFDKVYDIIRAGCEGLLDDLLAREA